MKSTNVMLLFLVGLWFAQPRVSSATEIENKCANRKGEKCCKSDENDHELVRRNEKCVANMTGGRNWCWCDGYCDRTKSKMGNELNDCCSDFEETCTVECRETKKWSKWSHCDCAQGKQKRRRELEEPTPDGKLCRQWSVEQQNCTCYDDCSELETWSSWGPCSHICGPGVRERTRKLESPKTNQVCNNRHVEHKGCNDMPCPDSLNEITRTACSICCGKDATEAKCALVRNTAQLLLADPVCASDGKTYSRCQLCKPQWAHPAFRKMFPENELVPTIEKDGECASDIDDWDKLQGPGKHPEDVAPKEDYYPNCNIYMERIDSQMGCPKNRRCCPRVARYVCSEEGETYLNECTLCRRNTLHYVRDGYKEPRVRHKGQCRKEEAESLEAFKWFTKKDSDETVPQPICNWYLDPECKDEEPNYRPVCASDRKLYESRCRYCFAKKANNTLMLKNHDQCKKRSEDEIDADMAKLVVRVR